MAAIAPILAMILILILIFHLAKRSRLQTGVKSCPSVPTTFLSGIDFGRFVVVAREQVENDACATAFYSIDSVISALR